MLTPRETQVLEMRADGMSNKEIGTRLGIDASTVGSHSKHLRRKLGANDNAHAVAIAFRAGLLPLQSDTEVN